MGGESVAVFIASSDNTRDVFDQVFPSFRIHWSDCPYPIYVGRNTTGAAIADSDGHRYVPVLASVSGWSNELFAQVQQLSADYVILFLDDFLLLRPVDTRRIVRLINEAIARNLDYVRLRILQRGLVASILAALRYVERNETLEEIPRYMPYFSGLQVALWKRSHLLASLAQNTDIWSFEDIVRPGAHHYAVRERGLVDYIHVVERGRWLPSAPALFRSSGMTLDGGARPFWQDSRQWSIRLGDLKFFVFGYAGIYLRRLTRFLKPKYSRSTPSDGLRKDGIDGEP